MDFFNEIKEARSEGKDIVLWKVQNWYKRLKKKYVTHMWSIESGSFKLKLTRSEFLFPHIDHSNGNEVIRKTGLPLELVATLFMLKNDLLPTQERLYMCGKAVSNRCPVCPRVDSQGHLFICGDNNVAALIRPITDQILCLDPIASIEKIINMDFAAKIEEKFAIGWIVATAVKLIFDCRRTGAHLDVRTLQGKIRADISILWNIPKLNKKCEMLSYIVTSVVK